MRPWAITPRAERTDHRGAAFVVPFVEAAADVLRRECGEQARPGALAHLRSPRTSDDVSVLIAVTGSVTGLAVYAMARSTACVLASRMLGEPVLEFGPLARSAIAELANVMTGCAGMRLERLGYPSDMAPPVLLIGRGSSIATIDLARLVVPLHLACGPLTVDLALREG